MITPPATIGMLGGGQLGRYALMAAATMGYRTVVLDPDPGAPAGVIADEHLVAAYDDAAALRRLAIECDVVTTEFENPPAASVEQLAAAVPVAPAPAAVAIAQDRIAEKRFLVGSGFPVGPYRELEDDADLRDDVPPGGAVIKTARLGYDGKGQRRVRNEAELVSAWAELGGVRCVVEELLDLTTELSVVVARTADGRTVSYAVTGNTHVDGILDVSVAPAHVAPAVADRATGLAMAIADALGYVGVLAVELFVVDGDRLLVNELAPRPHNSGHWTLDAATTSQFAQQVRAVCGLGLGDPSMTADAVAMVNLLGDVWAGGPPDWSPILGHPRASLHLYGKSEPRPGRKMGHLTVWGPNVAAARSIALDLRTAACDR